MAIETPKAEKAFDRNKALNNPEYLRFLSKTIAGKEKTLDMSDTDTLKRWHETFEVQTPVAKKLVEVFDKDIFANTRQKLSKEQKDLLTEHVMTVAAGENGPEEIKLLAEELENSEEYPKQIQKMTTLLKEQLRGLVDVSEPEKAGEELAARKKELAEKRDLLKAAQDRGHIPSFRRAWEKMRGAGPQKLRDDKADAAGAEAETRYGIKRADVTNALSETETILKKLNTLEIPVGEASEAAKTQIETLDTLQRKLFSELPPAEAIRMQVASKVQEKLAPLIAPGASRSDKQKGFEQLSQFQKLRSEGRDFIPDYEAEAIMTQVDEQLGEMVTKEVENVVRTKELGFRPLDELKAKLQPYISMDRIGARSKEDCRTLLVGILEGFKNDPAKLEGKEADKQARAYVIEGLIISLKQ